MWGEEREVEVEGGCWGIGILLGVRVRALAAVSPDEVSGPSSKNAQIPGWEDPVSSVDTHPSTLFWGEG